MKTVGIPRGLLYYYYDTLWKAFFDCLQVPYIISKKSNLNLLKKGQEKAVDEACLALKLYLGHIEDIKDQCDYILIPRIFSLEKQEQVCTNFNCLYDLIHTLYPNIQILNYNIDVKRHHYEKNAFLKLGKELGLIDESKFNFLWVVDWPQFEYDKEEGRYVSAHHPFTLPRESDIPLLATDPSKVHAQAYDIVLNGYELGGGSQRIYDQNVQERAFKALGFTQEQIDAQFGWFVEGLQYGTPPHGGFALGLDRIAMLLCGCDSLRDVIAFPKNTSATCPMSKAPTPVADAQLGELGIGVKEYESDKSE